VPLRQIESEALRGCLVTNPVTYAEFSVSFFRPSR
jgi:hypothetical protein